MQLTDFSQPTPIVSQTLADSTPGRALDIGSFEGRNALYLARRGWDVVAIDTDEMALATLRKVADDEKLPIRTVVADVRDYKPEGHFDAILSLMVFHFLPAEVVASTIASMQIWTEPNGINIITAFTEDNVPGTRPYLFPTNSLKDYYKSWDLLQYEETYSSWIVPEGKTEPERYMAARLVAKRI